MGHFSRLTLLDLSAALGPAEHTLPPESSLPASSQPARGVPPTCLPSLTAFCLGPSSTGLLYVLFPFLASLGELTHSHCHLESDHISIHTPSQIFSSLRLKRPFIHCQLDTYFSILLELIYNAVLVSGVQQSESVTHIHVSTLF